MTANGTPRGDGGTSAVTADPVLGFYGPGSQMWRINREAVLLGVGPASLLWQIAHPLVAEGVAAHSRYETDPFGRLRRTLTTTLDLVFGDGARAERAVRSLDAVHGRVHGEVHDPLARTVTAVERYDATDPELLLWVQATLVLMAVRAYRAWVGPVSATERERMWQEARRVGIRLGIERSNSPSSWPALEAWVERQMGPHGPVTITPTARRLSRSLIRPPLPLVPGPLVELAVTPGLALLPEPILEGYGIAPSRPRTLSARALGLGLKAWLRVLPADWRALPQARAAERRCRQARVPATT